MFQIILDNVLLEVKGARAVIFLDGDGESIAQAGEHTGDMEFLAAWKEIHLDQIRAIAGRLGMGSVHAVLFSHEQGNELVIPVVDEYSLVVFLSSYAHVKDALNSLKGAVDQLKKEIQ